MQSGTANHFREKIFICLQYNIVISCNFVIMSPILSFRPTGNTGSHFLKVHFHTVLSPEFKFDPKNDKLVILFGHTKLGNWGKNGDITRYVLQTEWYEIY